MSSSVICQNFVQNAWKKELCSNCFKSKDEHQERPKPKPITLISTESVEGIMKTKSKTNKRNVRFTKELIEVIGFGGEDCDYSGSDDDDDEGDIDVNDNVDDESGDEDADCKELKRLTKENTDYNTTRLKALSDSDKVKTSQLLLGKPLIDASTGRKQTLMVSITPFGEESSSRKFQRLSTPPIIATKANNKESTKTNVVLTSYVKNEDKVEKSLLDEISETLENGKNPIQLVAKKKTQQEITLTTKDDQKVVDDEKKKISAEKKVIGLTRTPALKRDQEKPVVYQTSTARIELNTKKVQNKVLVVLEPQKVPKSEVLLKGEDVVDSSLMMKTQSREQAGEPDGRADEDSINEPPALPLTPPPILDAPSSFILQQPIYDKPAVPSKPTTAVLARKPPPPCPVDNKPLILSTFAAIIPNPKTIDINDVSEPPPPITLQVHPVLSKQNSNGSDIASRVANKRRAPDPPEVILKVVERCDSLKAVNKKISPEPAPRKNISLSIDNLETVGGEDNNKRRKGRFSLKKFLKMGSSKDLHKISSAKSEEHLESPPLPKPRLVIVHPSELNGVKVEVLAKSDDYLQKTNDYETFAVKSVKPPPPPRNFDSSNGRFKSGSLGERIPAKLTKNEYNTGSLNSKKMETIYANIGEVRSGLVPNKPQRTASMRERDEAALQQQNSRSSDFVDESVYDYISSPNSSPSDCSNKTERINGIVRLNKRSESSVDVSGDYYKYGNIPRSMSLTYCGSETESEIYAPYSFYGSETEVTEDDHDWIQNSRTQKLRSRKGRSIVHKNLEDNYGAVVAANHEALAQVLDNIQQFSPILPALRGLKALSNLRWSDFSPKCTGQSLTVGCRTFHQANWGAYPVTLAVNIGTVPSSTLSLGNFNLLPITEFSDLVPAEYVNSSAGNNANNNDKEAHIQATVAIFPHLQVNSINSYSDFLKSQTNNSDEVWKSATFVMLQLVTALKTLQAQGIEEVPLSQNTFVLCKEADKDTHQRLYVLQGSDKENAQKDEAFATLCSCASNALKILHPNVKMSNLLQSLLNNERSVTLTQVKSVLEFCLWGPSDVILGSSVHERELALQRWLDLQRATVLHGLVCTRIQLTVYEEFHLLFLVRSNSRMMCDASLLLDSSNLSHLSRAK